MRTYELVLVIKSGISEVDRKKVLETVQKSLGEAKAEVVEWGKKPLSYPIKKETEGIYFLLNIDYPEESVIPEDFEKKLFANENILRHLFVKRKPEKKEVGSKGLVLSDRRESKDGSKKS